MKLKNIMLPLVATLALASCTTTKDVPYMTNAQQLSPELLNAAAAAADPTIVPGDMLQITVMASNPEVVKPFNKADQMPTLGNTNGSGGSNNGENSIYHYLVDNNGNIEFPLLGRLHLSGMSKSAAENYIASQIYPRYITEKPGVEIRFQNFRVYAIGEVSGPGVIHAPNGRLNLLEAIAQCGDLTIHGKRDNVMIIHTNADGSRKIRYVNLNDAKFITSPDFYLQQNDIIYVEPNATKARSSWNMPPALSFSLTLLGTLMSITTFVIALSKK